MSKKKQARLYVAYGSNLNLEQMEYRCPTAKVVGASELRGYRLTFRGGRYGAVANVEPHVGGAVPVLVWAITPADEAALDRYEGFPTLYRKETVRFELDGKPVDAMVYVMNEGKPLGQPNPYYYSVIREGYAEAGFDLEYLRRATIDKAGG
jgi:gamma-glutamylcyclotransferase (GGCT)/AIG2-like uncharacterized protein YtfP